MPLTLERRIGEAIVVCTNPLVRVRLRDVRAGGRAKLTIECDDQVPVFREELYTGDDMPSLAKKDKQ